MIVVKLMGGLGNQLFQYAVGRALALKHGTLLKVDTRFFSYTNDQQSTPRELELDFFNTQFEIATEKELDRFYKKTKPVRAVERLFPFLSGYHIINESGHEFHPEVLRAADNTYLNGYWQTEKYFKAIREVLLKDLELKEPINETNSLLAEACGQADTISVHIRRGDYVSNPSNLSYHGICSLEYYYEGIRIIGDKLQKKSQLFIFTDDPAWVKENFEPGCDFRIVDVNTGRNSYYDMYLMSRCHHNIIANSSFSWWGAWLNQHPDKIVIAPRQWFATKELDTRDVIPENWNIL